MTLLDELNEIRENYGTLTPDIVVKAASVPDHPLHDRFEWDDKIAGPMYRLEQASLLLRVVRLPREEGKEYSLRAFVAVKGESTNRAEYVPTEEALSDPFTRKLVLQEMKREWLVLKRRYEHMAEFAEMIRDSLGEND